MPYGASPRNDPMPPRGSPEPIPGRCGARTRTGGFCTQWPMHGGRRCRMHGGSIPAVRVAAARRLERERVEKIARRQLARLGLRLDIDPLDALLAVVQGAAADVVVLEAMVADLDAAQLISDRPPVVVELLRQARSGGAAGIEGGARCGRGRTQGEGDGGDRAATRRRRSSAPSTTSAGLMSEEARTELRQALARRLRDVAVGGAAP